MISHPELSLDPANGLDRESGCDIRLFAYPSFSKYSLRRYYHMRSDCFNPYRDCCNLIEHILQDFVLFALGNLNSSRIFMYMSLSMDPYR